MKYHKDLLLIMLIALPGVGFSDSAATDVVWKNSVAMGATYKDGNTEKSLFTLHIKADRFSEENDWLNNLYGEYGKTEGDQTEGQFRGQSDYRHKFGGGNFFGGAFGEAYTDSMKQIRTRLKLGPDVGYYFINKETMKFDTSIGLNWVYERTVLVEHDFVEIRAAANYLWDFTETASYYFNIEYSVNVEDANDGNGLLTTGLKTKVSDQLSLFVELRDEYDNIPDGVGVEHNDVTAMAGLAYDF